MICYEDPPLIFRSIHFRGGGSVTFELPCTHITVTLFHIWVTLHHILATLHKQGYRRVRPVGLGRWNFASLRPGPSPTPPYRLFSAYKLALRPSCSAHSRYSGPYGASPPYNYRLHSPKNTLSAKRAPYQALNTPG